MKIKISKKQWSSIGSKAGWLKESQYFQEECEKTNYSLDDESKIIQFVLDEVVPLANNYSTRFEAIKRFRQIPGKRRATIEEMNKYIQHVKNRKGLRDMWVAKNKNKIKK